MGIMKRIAESGGRMGGRSSVSSVAQGQPLNVTAEINSYVDDMFRQRLARLFLDDPDLRKAVRNAIRQELKEARKRITRDVRSSLLSDPRKAYLAVKYSLYKQMLGGNISILNPRRTGARYKLVRQRKLDLNPTQRGGNRRPVNENLNDRSTYFGKDRAFILRFLNSGTDERMTRFGSRGSLRAKRMFEVSSAYQMETAADNISKMLEDVIAASVEKEK